MFVSVLGSSLSVISVKREVFTNAESRFIAGSFFHRLVETSDCNHVTTRRSKNMERFLSRNMYAINLVERKCKAL